ncbi:MAG TPA: ABC transporter substrate-binding protein, partial [Candidatus Kapabacteria bacterium]|nr:ABC transporter substrate-binding protein [Candidatus Kapabacteria bacterium]
LAISAVVGLTALVSCQNKESATDANEVRIGEFASLTGNQATFGQSQHNGIKLAVDEMNANGGVLGKKIDLHTEDDQSKSEEAATVVQKLINRDNVVAILGEVASSNTLAAAPICQHEKIPLVTPASTNPKVTEIGDDIFRVCYIDPFQGTANAKFAFNVLHAKNVAVLKDIRNDYSVGLAKYFDSTFLALGGQVPVEQAYSNGDKDFNAQLTEIKAKSPDAIFIPGYYTDINLIAIQARELGITCPLFGGDGWDSPELLGGKGKDALENCYFTTHASMEDTSALIQNFVKKYKAAYGTTPDAIAALGYDAARILIDAISRAKSTASDGIRTQLASMKDFPGVTGNITIDANRNATKPLVVVKINGGQYHYFQTIQP